MFTKVPKILKSIHKFADPFGPVVQWIAPIAIGGSFLHYFQVAELYFVYIIQSEVDRSFYIGFTQNLIKRLELHNDSELNQGVTRHKIPWRYFFTIRVPDKSTAIKIEKHIKRMKSQSFILNLKKYPEMSEKLFKKYS